jgi:radical SAM protein with 4Fe4S-binding SPASM domain
MNSLYPKKILFGLHEKSCNLSCPKCLVHSADYPRGIELKKKLGRMHIDDVIRIFDEIKGKNVMVSPSFWSEPLLNKKLFIRFVLEAKKRGIPVNIGTNGLLIDDDMVDFLIDNVDIISVSIDATTQETLLKTRGTDRLKDIHKAVMNLLEKRADNNKPRITVNFSEEDANTKEKNEFIKHWLKHVDAIRVNEVYSDKKEISKSHDVEKRYPCRELYDNMAVDYDGTYRVCCLDGYRETNLGNVFKDGVKNIWNGEKIVTLRKQQEQEEFHKFSFCSSCDQWAGFNIIKEYVKDDLLVRETAYSTYYNRMDRMDNWSKKTKRIERKINR